jgi:uncharacterized BrkB/YihY/UPF0761 family membrane protein
MSGRPPEIYEIIFVFFILAVSVVGTLLSITIVRYLGFSFDKDFIGAMWRLTFFEFLFLVFPMSIAVEIWWVREKKRKFRLRGVLASALMVFEFMLVLSVVGLVFENVLPGLFYTHEAFSGETGLVLGFLVGMPLLILVFTMRTPRIQEYLRRSFE